MQRIPEPDLMNEAAQAQAYSEADFSEPHDACINEFQRCFPRFNQGRVLDLGCGPADISCRFARAYPETTLVGVDGATAMLQLGEQRVRKLGLTQRISLHQAYLPDDPIPHTGEFSAILSNSLLHHLQDPMALWSTIKQQLTQTLSVFVMDLMRPANIDAARSLVTRYAEDEADILKRDFFHSLCAAYRPDEIENQLDQAGLNLEIQVISDRHLIVFGDLKK